MIKNDYCWNKIISQNVYKERLELPDSQQPIKGNSYLNISKNTNNLSRFKPTDLETTEDDAIPLCFGTSKGKKHADLGEIRVKSTRHGRQYMNRRGGFNRPLPPERSGIRLNDF